MQQAQQHAHAYATFGAVGAWDFLVKLLEHGPAWETMPGLMMASVALVYAVNTARNDAVARDRARAHPEEPFKPCPPTLPRVTGRKPSRSEPMS